MANGKRTIVQKYDAFHGVPPIRVRRIKLPAPTGGKLIKIGRLTEIHYVPETPSRLTGVEFSHKFGDFGTMRFGKKKPLLVTDGKELFIIRDGAPYRFNSRGIVG